MIMSILRHSLCYPGKGSARQGLAPYAAGMAGQWRSHALYSWLVSKSSLPIVAARVKPRPLERKLARQAIADAEVFLAKARELVAEAVGPEVGGDVAKSA